MAKGTSRVGKNDLVGTVAGTTELTKENTKKVVNAVLDGIFTTLKQTGQLQLTKFGTFSVRKTKGRQGRNPATGQPITIPPGYRLGFKVSKSWKTGMMLRQREQAKDKVKVHTHKEAPKAKAAAKLLVKKPPVKAKKK